MGKPKKIKDFTDELTEHYGVALTVTAEKSGAGNNCTVKINTTQACAGVSCEVNGKVVEKISPSKTQCGDMAKVAEEKALALHSTKKKMTQNEIYSVGN